MRSRILTVFMIPLSVIIGAVLGEILVRTLTPFPINVETANTVPHEQLSSPLKKALLTGFHSTAKHNATKAVSPSSETMRTI